MASRNTNVDNITNRVDEGERLLAAADGVAVGAAAKKLAAFTKAHGAYARAAKKTSAAEEAWRVSQERVAEADVDQDHAVDKLAAALAGEGLPRANPFKTFGSPAPSVVTSMGYEDEAKAVRTLTTEVRKRKGLANATYTAAQNALASANKVDAVIARSTTAHESYRAALLARDVLAQPWETAFAALKRGVRAAEDDGAKGLYARLFAAGKTPARTTKPPAKKGTAGAPTTAK